MSQSTAEAAQRTRAFARVLGPFVAVATAIIAIRLPSLSHLLSDLFTSGILPWILGAMMLLMGLVVIAFHQYWYSLTAVLISLFGWFVALRGVAMMAFPSAIDSGADATINNPTMLVVARIFFLLLTLMGLWLTYVGWRRHAPVDNSSVVTS